MTTALRSDDIETMSFEDALTELEGIVRELEAGQDQLDAAIAKYERGAKLRAHCEAKLREAEAKVERITKAADGTAQAGPADID